MLMYIERWLTAPMQMGAAASLDEKEERHKAHCVAEGSSCEPRL